MNPHIRPAGPFSIRIPNMKTFRFAAFLLSACSLLSVTGRAENNQNPNVYECCACYNKDSINISNNGELPTPEQISKAKGEGIDFLLSPASVTGAETVTVTVKRLAGKDHTDGTNSCANATIKARVYDKYEKQIGQDQTVTGPEFTFTVSDLDPLKGYFILRLEECDNTDKKESNPDETCWVEVKFDFSKCEACSSNTCDAESDQGYEDNYNEKDNGPDGDFRYSLMSFPLGNSYNGDTKANVVYMSKSGNGKTSTWNPGPKSLSVSGRDGLSIVKDGSGFLSSAQTDSAVLSVVPLTGLADPNAFKMEFRHRSAGGAGDIYQTVTIETVGTGTAASLKVTTIKDGKTEVVQFTEPDPHTKIKTTGNGLNRETISSMRETDGSGRVQRTISEMLMGDGVTYQKIGDRQIKYTRFPWGTEITKEVIDPDGAALVTVWKYYQSGEVSDANGSTLGNSRLKSMNRYDGYEESCYYGANKKTTISSYAGDSQGVTTVVGQNPLAKITTTTRSVGENVISQSVEIHGENMVTRRQNGDAPNGSQAVTEYYPIGQDFGRKIKKISHPDGMVTLYEYSRAGGTMTTTTYQGVPGDSNISEGTKTVRAVNAQGHEESQITTAVGTGNGIVLSHWVVLSSDAYGRPLSIGYFPDGNGGYAYTTSNTYNCCGVATETDKYGITTTYAYDDLKRMVKTNRIGVTTATVYNGLTVSTHRYPESPAEAIIPNLSGATAENLISKTVTVPDTAGTKTETWTRSAANGSLICISVNTTTYLNPASDNPASLPAGIGRREVVKTADDFIQTTDSYKDGKTYETFGDLSPTMRYAYSVNAIGEVTSQSYVDGANLRETTTTQSDRLGRTVSTTKGSITQTQTYNFRGQLVKSTDADNVSTLYAYNTKGERTTTALDVNGNGQIDFDGADHITVSTNAPGTYNSVPVITTTTSVYASNGSDTATTVSISHRTPDGLQSWSLSLGVANPAHSMSSIGTGGSWSETSIAPDGAKTISIYTGGRLTSTENHSSLASSSLLYSVSYGYDSLGRPVTTTDSRTGTTTTSYVSTTCNAVLSITEPGNRVTTYGYDSQGRRITTTLPDNSVTNTSYYPDGQVKASWGSQTYPTFTFYDYAGRQKTLRTSPTLASGVPTDEGGSVTTWNYSSSTGQLLSKLDAAGKGAIYSYTPAGRLLTRTNARNIATSYYYDLGGRLRATDYSDSTPDILYTYDRLGRMKTAAQGILAVTTNTPPVGSGGITLSTTLRTSALSYDPDKLFLTTEAIDYGGGFTKTLNRHTDAYGRPRSLSISGEYATAYGYDNAGRLKEIWDHPTLTLGEPSGNPSFTYGYLPDSGNLVQTVTGPAHTVTNTWEPTRNILATKINEVTVGTHSIPSSFAYGVNAIGQRETLGPVLDNSDNPVSTYTPKWAWDYNDRGELAEADDQAGSNDRAFQFDSIGNREKTVNGLLGDLPTTNNWTANALNQYTKAKGITLPTAPTAAPYDFDGNLRFDGGVNKDSENREYVWDAENRLVAVKRTSDDATLVTYAYDHLSRLISRTSTTNNPPTTIQYLYDGWNRIAEYSGTELKMSYVWGMDLSGTMQGAGGVGGLLSVSEILNGQISNRHYPTYDGNGNVSEYIDSVGALVAHFEYDPFGNAVVNTDSGNLFNYRFSTKPLDQTTGLYYYGYRFYDPLTGRWSSRDPIEETGGLNLYGFVGNDGVNAWDYLGMEESSPKCCCVEDIILTMGLSKAPEGMTQEEVNQQLGIGPDGAFDNENRVGHAFLVTINLSYKKAKTKLPCKYTWSERTNLPAFDWVDSNKWTNMFNPKNPARPAVPAGFGNMDEQVFDKDSPSLSKRLHKGKKTKRKLEISIVVASGGSICKHKKATRAIEQDLAIDETGKTTVQKITYGKTKFE